MKEIYFAIITIIVAFLGIVFSGIQTYLACKKRKDDLFELRYKFYKDFYNFLLKTNSDGPIDITDLFSFSEKASFLFSKRISDYILTFENYQNSNTQILDADLLKYFEKYLRLS